MAWLNLVGLAILPTVVSTATLAIATRNIGATKASVLGVFEPVTAILIGTVVFGEALTTNIIVGILLSIAAITFMIAKTKR
jgi:drug/metabolite transporter (DMT)-like permease